jgi:hypothetical protein
MSQYTKLTRIQSELASAALHFIHVHVYTGTVKKLKERRSSDDRDYRCECATKKIDGWGVTMFCSIKLSSYNLKTTSRNHGFKCHHHGLAVKLFGNLAILANTNTPFIYCYSKTLQKPRKIPQTFMCTSNKYSKNFVFLLSSEDRAISPYSFGIWCSRASGKRKNGDYSHLYSVRERMHCIFDDSTRVYT